jgi:hypothetical protein
MYDIGESLVVVNSTDITNYIIKDTYEVNSEPVYTSWEDGNYVEHRVYPRDKVRGSFEIITFGATPRTAFVAFLNILKAATTNHVLTIGLYVQNEGVFRALNCFYTVESTQHAVTDDGRYVDRAKISIEER